MNKNIAITSVLSIALLLPIAGPAFADVTEINPTNTYNPTKKPAPTPTPTPTSTPTQTHTSSGSMSGTGAMTGDEPTSINETNTISLKQQNRDEHLDMKAGAAIDTRIKSLTELSTRIAGIKILTPSIVQSLQSSLTAEITAMSALKAKIDADTSTASIKADAELITKANRVYLLVEPKARIAAASARLNAVVTQFKQLGTKLDARITAAASTGKDMTAARAALTDFNAKVAEAKVLADSAVTLTINLQVDNGDKTVLAANNAALIQARQKLQAAEADLVQARKDAASIAKYVKGIGGTATTH